MIIRTLSTADIRKCFLAGANALDARKEIINDLNVFPVPDGDTGTNMTMTIMSAAREVAALEVKQYPVVPCEEQEETQESFFPSFCVALQKK